MARPAQASKTQAMRQRAKEMHDTQHLDTVLHEHHTQSRNKNGYAQLDAPNKSKTLEKLVSNQTTQLKIANMLLVIMVIFLSAMTWSLYDDSSRLNEMMAFGDAKMRQLADSGVVEAVADGTALFRDEFKPWVRDRMSQASSIEGEASDAASKLHELLDKGYELEDRFEGMLNSGITIGGTPKQKLGWLVEDSEEESGYRG